MGNLLSETRHSKNPEKDLYVAVIYQAFRDADRLHDLELKEQLAKQSNLELHPTVKIELEAAREAMEWLTEPSEDLDFVCQMAGFETQCLLAVKDQLVAGELKSFGTWTRAA